MNHYLSDFDTSTTIVAKVRWDTSKKILDNWIKPNTKNADPRLCSLKMAHGVLRSKSALALTVCHLLNENPMARVTLILGYVFRCSIGQPRGSSGS